MKRTNMYLLWLTLLLLTFMLPTALAWEENGFTAEAVTEQQIMVSPGTSLTLTVKATCDKGKLNYRWESCRVGEYAQEIKGVDGPSLVIDSADYWTFYDCYVTDEYDNRERIEFFVKIENDVKFLSAREGTFYMEPGGSVTMNVKATCARGALTYRWVGPDFKDIEGATSPSYTARKVGAYQCFILDQYGCEMNSYFYVKIDNGFSAQAENGQNIVPAVSGSTPTLKVDARCKNGELHYKWYEQDSPSDLYIAASRSSQGRKLFSNMHQVEASGSTLKIQPVYRDTSYWCMVSDDYGNSETVTFNIILLNSNDREIVLRLISYATSEGDNGSGYALGEVVQIPALSGKGSIIGYTGDCVEVYSSQGYINVRKAGTAKVYVQYDDFKAIYTVIAEQKPDMVVVGKSIRQIADQAFMGNVNLRYVTLSANVRTVGCQAFADTDLQYIEVNGMNTVLEEDAIPKTATVICYPGSKAETYARAHDIPYAYIP